MIIGIVGKLESGKTTLYNYLLEHYNFCGYNMSDPLKKIANIFGFSNEKIYGSAQDKLHINEIWNVSSRTFLQIFGSEICRNILPNYFNDVNNIWLKLFDNFYKNKKNNQVVVVGDVRFLDEAEYIKQNNGILIKLNRNTILNSYRNIDNQHQSEIESNKINCDYEINNDFDKKYLFEMIDKILNKYSFKKII